MAEKPIAPSQQASIIDVLVNILFPVLILDYCSDGAMNPLQRLPEQAFWELGPVCAMALALMLPLVYGLYSLIGKKKLDLMSVVGFVGVLLTGIVTVFVMKANGQIHESTPWLFGAKESAIPIFLAAAVIVSHKSNAPLLNTFLYNPNLFDIPRIEQAVSTRNQAQSYQRLLRRCTWMLAMSLIVSAIANYFLCLHYLTPVLSLPTNGQQIAYNQAVSSITWQGFLIIGVPLLATLGWVLYYLVKRIESLTLLSRDHILMGR